MGGKSLDSMQVLLQSVGVGDRETSVVSSGMCAWMYGVS
jgi:hypothetical protein